MNIKIPCGKRSNILNIGGRKVRYILEDAVKSGINGYLRVTTERKGLEDYYLFVHGAGIVGAYGELEEGILEGPKALERAAEVTEGVVDLRTLDQEAVQGFLLAFPNLHVKGLGEGAGDLGGHDYNYQREVLLKKYNLREPSEEFVDSLVKDFLGA